MTTVIGQSNLIEEDKFGNMGAVRYAYRTLVGKLEWKRRQL
jgi:hypothetical protein